MAISSRRRQRSALNIWPGFVDALSQLIMVIVFVLLIFTAGQFYLTDALSGRDAALQKLTAQVNQLTDMLDIERKTSASLKLTVTTLGSQLQTVTAQRDALQTQVTALAAKANEAQQKLDAQTATLAEAQKSVSVDKDKIDLQVRQIASLQQDIAALKQVRDQLETKVTGMAAQLEQNNQDLTAARDRSKELEAKLSTAEERTALAQKQIDASDVRVAAAETTVGNLSAQIANLQQELARIATALDASEAKNKDQQVQLADLGRRLNQALASKVEELAQYRSEFFGRLRQVLGDRPDIRIVGDRFVFQSEVLFDPGSAALGPDAQQRLALVAGALKAIAGKIPTDIPWLLEVEGYTDDRPINTQQFPSNWELSTARALSVVRYLVAQGIPPNRLAAAGYGQYQPIDSGNTPADYRRNRRIELKLTEP
ncbi:MAG TPA: peptidoglycan -binding protein [Stellaceae bacterium]|nr:peptidoglycan -binding protein [Stellaceae bacterium]